MILFLNPQHLQTTIPNLLLIKPALLQMLYELRVILLESCQHSLSSRLAPASRSCLSSSTMSIYTYNIQSTPKR